MPLLPAPAQLSHLEKDALIAALTARLALADKRIAAQDAHIAAQDARIAALEARLDELTRPPKTPGNSSKPPSQGQKQDLPAPATDRPPRKSRPGVGRTLHPNPDRAVDELLTTCPKCEAVFPDALQTPQQVYERIELPPDPPGCDPESACSAAVAPCCGERVTAAAPAGLEPGSPFGHSIAAMVVYLHYAHAIGMERLALLMDELFSLSISEGAICNILARAPRAAAGRHGGDRESRARQSGGLLRRDLGAGQGQELVGMGVHRHAGGAARDHTQPGQGGGDRRCSAPSSPMVWVSDMLGSQRGHARADGRCAWRTCCATRQYAIECGDTAFSAPFRWLLLRAIAIGRRRETLKDTTLKQYLYDLDRRLDRIMAAVPIGEPGRKLHKRMLANRAHLFVFMTNRAVPYYEQHLRAASAAERDLPQGDQRIPLRVGGGNLCRLPLRRQHREGQSRFGA